MVVFEVFSFAVAAFDSIGGSEKVNDAAIQVVAQQGEVLFVTDLATVLNLQPEFLAVEVVEASLAQDFNLMGKDVFGILLIEFFVLCFDEHNALLAHRGEPQRFRRGESAFRSVSAGASGYGVVSHKRPPNLHKRKGVSSELPMEEPTIYPRS